MRERRLAGALTFWEKGILVLALARLALGAMAVFAPPAGPPFLAWPLVRPEVLVVLLFGAVGIALLHASRLAAPAAHLAGFLLVLGSTYAAGLLRALAAWLPAPFGDAARVVGVLHPDAFLAYLLWAFVARFPVSAPPPPRAARIFLGVAAAGGAVLFAATVVDAAAGAEALGGAARALSRRGGAWYWRFVFTLAALAIPYALFRAARTRGPDRQRLTLFLAALTAGYGPVFVDSLLQAWIPGLVFRRPPWVQHLWVALLLTTPLTTAYAVAVHRVLDVRLVVRRAIQYALARVTVLAAIAVPFVSLVLYLLENRRMAVGDLFSGTRPLVLLGALALGIAALGARRRLLEGIDRRFFREQYDAGRTLTALVERGRRAGSVEELSELLETEVDRALHLTSASLLLAEPRRGGYASREGHLALPSGSGLPALLEGSAEPLEIEADASETLIARLGETDRAWLAATQVRLLVPLVGSDGAVLGVLALGEKRSELPFTREDRALLSAIASSAAVALENRLLRTSHAGRETVAGGGDAPAPAEALAFECAACGLVHAHDVKLCVCGQPLVPGRVPFLFLGKFRLEQRVGAGGMGVVYRARDLALGRPVALKTLPRVSPEYAMRLRREARASASLSHPAIALVFGAESWRGVPVLVFEYLPGGTLADLLRKGPLPAASVVGLGMVLCDALGAAHGRGVLHRDIKPSNIGFTDEGSPKLLDFGLARILFDGRAESAFAEPSSSGVSQASTSPMTLQTISASGHAGTVVGTPAYMSPEAITGAPPDESVDLWSLGVVLYEAATGVNPFLRPSVDETFQRIRKVAPPDPRELVPGLPLPFAALLRDLVARDPSRRPASAAELRKRLGGAGEASG